MRLSTKLLFALLGIVVAITALTYMIKVHPTVIHPLLTLTVFPMSFGIFLALVIGMHKPLPGEYADYDDEDEDEDELDRLSSAVETKKPHSKGVEGEVRFVNDETIGTLKYVFTDGAWEINEIL